MATENEDIKPEVKTSFFKKDGMYVEEILMEDKTVAFAVYNPSTDDVKIVKEYETKDYVFKPLEGQEVREGHIYLPSKTEEYGTEEQLEEDIKNFIKQWLDIPEDFLQYCVWEIKQSWVYDRLNTINYLRFLGDTGQGKTRALSVVGFLHYKPIKTSGASTVAPIFRIIHKWKGTLLVDEFDLKKSDETADFIKLINLGFEKNNPIMRCEQNNYENVQFFDPYCPKVIATRKPFDDKATESRCFTQIMRGTSNKGIPSLLDNGFYRGAQILRNKLLLWRFRNYGKIKIENYRDIDLGDIEPRIKQTHLGLLPLFAKDNEKLEFFKDYLMKLQGRIVLDRQQSFEGKIVVALCKLLDLGFEDIAPVDIIEQGQFVNMRKPEEPMSPIAFSKYLKELGLNEREVRYVGKDNNGKQINKNCIVWTKEQLENLKRRYGINEI
jgi:hypothetical protein